ncbi:MAG: SUMF1/EgtB/PvdO family nonheme iron enzyme [Kiritimatiellae bacterium]|nr:SUMF1/EgtB/PvdO family nonheme iron enzyme [Kiritimatiellia bacterium]
MRRLVLVLAVGMAVVQAFPDTLHEAVLKDDLSAVVRIVRTSPRSVVNATTAGGVGPLHLAAALNRVAVAGYLLHQGAIPDMPTENGFTPLHWAAARDSVEVLQLLLARGANPNYRARAGITPLHWAAAQNATNVIKVLLRAGADCTAKSAEGLTPLHWALSHRSQEAAVILASKLADVGLADVVDGSEAETGGLLGPVPPDRPSRATARVQSVGIPPPIQGSIFGLPIGFGETLNFVWVEPAKLWVGQTEITNAQYRRFNPRHDSRSRGRYSLNEPDQPAVFVSWHDAKAFCNWVTCAFSSQLPPGSECRLPTSAEWTLVARCGTEGLYPWGDTWPPKYGNFADITTHAAFPEIPGIDGYCDGHAVTAPVGDTGTNEWGLVGMGDNVWEWCEDWYDAAHKYKVRMGGAWDTARAAVLRTDYRGFDRPSTRDETVGFRVVLGTVRRSDPMETDPTPPGAGGLPSEAAVPAFSNVP